MEGCAALFQEGRARSRFRGTIPWQGWPHPCPSNPANALDSAFASRRGGLQAGRLHLSAGPERVTHSNQDERRVSAAMGYLDRETRKRPNLTISTHTQVGELLFEGTRCIGVKALVNGNEQEFCG